LDLKSDESDGFAFILSSSDICNGLLLPDPAGVRTGGETKDEENDKA